MIFCVLVLNLFLSFFSKTQKQFILCLSLSLCKMRCMFITRPKNQKLGCHIDDIGDKRKGTTCNLLIYELEEKKSSPFEIYLI